MKKFRRKVLDMLMSNNSGSSLRQQLLDGAPFRSSLLYTAVPQRAASGTTGTFTRATTSTWQNNDGYLVTGVAGEIGFVGARRVYNQMTNTGWTGGTSGTLGSGGVAPTGWTALGGTGSITFSDSAAHSGSKSIRFQATAQRPYIQQSIAVLASSVYMMLVTVEAATTANLLSNLLAIATVPAGATSVYLKNGAVVDGPTTTASAGDVIGMRLTVSTTTGTPDWRIGLGAAGSPTGDVTLAGPRLVNITAETDQTTAREYVSVGVPGDWVGDELVTNGTFDTDTTGWTAANSAALSATGSELTITNAGATYGYAYQALTTVIGAKYILRCVARRGTVATVFLQAGNTAGTGTLVNQNTTSTTSVVLSAEFTATATTTYVTLISDNTNNGTAIFDSVVCKPAYYHGSFVDGVKCFPTDLAGNPIPSTTLLGYLAQGARTNVCLQSNAFTTTWTNNGTPAAAQNAVGPDGATSAWTLTDDSAVVAEGIYQSITLTAAVYTMSVFVKKTTGAQSSYPVIYANTGSTIALATIDTSNGVATCWTTFTGMTILAAATARCSSYNSNFWRVELSYTATAAAYVHFLLPAATTNSTQSTGTLDLTAQGSAVFYGAQVELGSFASPYIATTTIAVARDVDALTYSGGDIPNLKTLSATFRRESGVSGVGVAVAQSDGGLTETTNLYLNTATEMRSNGTDGGASQWAVVASNAYAPGASSSAALSMATNDIKTSFGGTSGTQDTSATIPTVTQLNVGHMAGSFQLSGNVGGIYGWTRNLSASELQAITS